MKQKLLTIAVPLLVLSLSISAQRNYPKDYFIAPVKFPTLLSGTFAELRSNHFHSGIDIKTQGVEGKEVLACADGYVSRIKISPYGFGKALYIVHPNGYTSVYGHLKSFSPEIQAWTIMQQYQKESFDVDLFPEAGLLKVKKGEVIAFSGNTGSSGGPHLHFEIRDSRTERPINPLLFGFDVKDFTRPTINAVRLYPEGPDGKINGNSQGVEPMLTGWGPTYQLKLSDTVRVAGGVSFGVNAHDLMNSGSNKNGINNFAVLIDSVVFFEWDATEFGFDESRYINSFIDFARYQSIHQRYMRTRLQPNNKLSCYKTVKNQGIFSPRAGKIYPVKIVIADGLGNESVISFIIKGETTSPQSIANITTGQTFSYKRLNQFSTPDFRISLPGECLYDSISFSYSSSNPWPNTCSYIHNVHTEEVPLHAYYDMYIGVGPKWQKNTAKLTVVKLNSSNKPTSVGGIYENGFMHVRAREFGRYAVMADSIAPAIKALNISNKKNIQKQTNIRCSISDDLSGIKSYRPTLNGKWILMDYDPKKRLLEYMFDERLKPGNNLFVLTVEDYCGNVTKYEATLIF